MRLPISASIQPDNTHKRALQSWCLARQAQTTLGNNITLNLRRASGYSTGDGHEIQALDGPSQRRPFRVRLELAVEAEHLHTCLRDTLEEFATEHFEGRRLRARNVPFGLDRG